MSNDSALSVNMTVAVSLLELFVVMVILAFALTFVTGTVDMQIVSGAAIIPIVILGLIFIRHCRRKEVWSYAGATILGAAWPFEWL
jgi:glycerol uptake facilitator-like aquaporin